MRAARLTLAGSEPRFELQELPDPVEGSDEVVVELVTAALNRRDWWLWRAPGTPTPVTLGSDGAGRVAAVGAGVGHLSPGDEVVIDPTLNWGDDHRDDPKLRHLTRRELAQKAATPPTRQT